MKRGEPRRLQYTERHGQMTAVHSIRDFFDVALELITNSDDSYHGQHRDGVIPHDGGPILLDIEPHRGKTPSIVRVRDRAAGFHDLAAKLERVGSKTSQSGDRGFMARGLKDCAAVGHVVVETIFDGCLDKAEITPAFELIPYKSNRHGGDPAKREDRNRLGIPRSGTVVEVALEPRVKLPLAETLRRDFPWHFALRDIMGPATASKVLLRYSGGDPELLQRAEPDAEIVYDREHEVPGYPGRRFRFTLSRAKAPLEDPTDPRFRRTGIVIKGQRANYSCSFIRSELERDPAAPHYFGRLECEGIDALAEEWDERRGRGERHPNDNPIFILDPNRRAGLAEDHPFVQALVQLPVEVIKQEFERERKERASRQREVESKETTDRLRKLAREASRFMREKLEDLGAVTAGDVVDDTSFHKSGVAISPIFAQIPVGQTKTFIVKVDGRRLDLPPGTVVKIILSKAAEEAIELLGEPTDLEPDPIDATLLRGSFSLRGRSESRRVLVGCEVNGLDPLYANLQVVPAGPVDRDIQGDFSFHRNSYTVRLGGRRSLILRARLRGSLPPQPSLRFQDPSVAVLRSPGVFELVPGTTYYEAAFSVEGRKTGGKTCVIAQANGRRAECELLVVEREDEGVDLKFKLVPHDLGANYRAAWDRKEPNTLLITTHHESIRRYLGRADDGYPGQHSQPFRVLLAELISDNVCRRIVEESARAQPQKFDSDRVYLLHNKLMKEFTPVAHKIQLAAPMVFEPSRA